MRVQPHSFSLELPMHMEKGLCAYCGRQISDYTFIPDGSHEAEIAQYAAAPPDPQDKAAPGKKLINSNRPYFCTFDCAQRAVDEDIEIEYRDELTELTRQCDHKEGNDFNAVYEKLKAFRIGHSQYIIDHRPDHYRKYFKEYYEQRQQLRRDDNRAWQVRDHAETVTRGNKETADRERQAEKDAAAQEKQRLKEEELQRRDEEKRRIEEERLRLEAEEAERMKPVPLVIPTDHSRFESVHILGAAGSGKTTLIQEFLKHDLTRSDPPGLIVIDPKGTLIERLRALKILDPSRLIVIDATHQYPAKLELFVKSNVPGVDPEQVISQAVSTYRYIFQSTNFSFTSKQAILFEYVVRLMFEIGGTLSTLIDFLRIEYNRTKQQDRDKEQIAKYAPLIAALPDDMREFFEIDLQASYEGTAKEIGVRLQQIRQKPILRAMFDTTERRVDLFDCMQKRKVVLVNTGMSRDQAASQMIGRFIIAMALNATYVRALMHKSHWHPNFLMIDEFQEFVDAEKTPEMLRKVREYNVGVMMAHHNMYGAELDDAMRVAISTNTSVKFCADPRGMDLGYMARDFDCDSTFLRKQQVTDTHVRFAHVMRRVHDTPISVIVPRGNLAQYATWDARTLAEHDRLNTKLVHGDTTPVPKPVVSPPPKPVVSPAPVMPVRPIVAKPKPVPPLQPKPTSNSEPDPDEGWV